MPRVQVLEDDDLLASTLARALRAKGFEVDVAHSIGQVQLAIDCDLVLCDLGLPDGDGIDFIQTTVASRPGLPIIALTARSEDAEIVTGLISGAVDYVTKPFRLAELLARVDSQIRLRVAALGTPGEVIQVGDLTIDAAARRVHAGGVEVDLRPREFDLLLRLALGLGTVVARERLMNDVWKENWWGSTKTLDVHVNSIRRKLGEDPGRPSRISAVRGVGYRLETT